MSSSSFFADDAVSAGAAPDDAVTGAHQVTAQGSVRSVDMTDGICFVGLDVHARKTAAAAVQLGSGEVFKAQLSGSPAARAAMAGDAAGPRPRRL